MWCDTNSINIGSVDRMTRTNKSPCLSKLVTNDPPTHLVILFTTSRVSDPLTATSVGSPPTHPVWRGDLQPHVRTVLGGTRHVEVGYTSPAS